MLFIYLQHKAMSHNIPLFIVLVLAFGSFVRSQCVPTNNPAVSKLSGPLASSLDLTFDDYGFSTDWFGSNGNTLDLSKPNQSITLFQQPYSQSALCGVINYPYAFNGKTMSWNARGYWSGSTTEKVGYSVVGNPYGLCTFQFSPPIYAFVARMNTYDVVSGLPGTYFRIYDKDSTGLDCQDIPIVAGTNTYAELGFISTIPITYLDVFADQGLGYFLDNLQILSCGQGFNWNGTECVDTDECLSDPCAGGHVTCLNTIGSYSCLCDEGYETKNGTCQEIDRCTPSPCSQFATCVNTNTSSFNCTCNEGYEGDGVGQNGCQAVIPPMSSSSPSVSNTPSDNSPSSSNAPSAVQPSAGEPNSQPVAAGKTPRSSLVSTANVMSAINAVLLVLLIAFA